MTVVYFHRKNPHKYISIEAYFDNVRRHLPADIKPVVAESKYFSQGFFKRIYNLFEAAFKQGDVNHITGDVHYLALLLRKKKTILTIHDLGFLKHPNPIARKIFLWFWVKLPVRRVQVVTAVSEETKRDIIAQTNCNPDKIQVIPTCISSQYKKVEKPFNAAYPVILQIGTAFNKNCERMAMALAGLPCKLHIIGLPGDEYMRILKENKIDFEIFTHLSNEQMVQQYVDCDILLFASLLEGFGMPILEANTVGRVVITSNLSSMPEVANDAACLVDPMDINSIRAGVDKVINNTTYSKDLIEKGFENAKRFRVDAVSRAYSKLYESILN